MWARRWSSDRVEPSGGGSGPGREADDGIPADAPRLRVVTDDRYPGWEEVYRDNVGRVYGIMFARVGNRVDAEDLTAEVFTAALRPLRLTASVGEVRAYLLATARTVLAAHWRRTLGVLVSTLDEELVEATLTETGGGPEASAKAEKILRALPPRYEQVLRLRFMDSCTIRETAAEIGVSVANAKVLQHRALRKAAELCEGTAP